MDKDVRLILTTEADLDTARRLANELLERGIVACVTMSSVQSMYSWHGEIEDAEEVQLILKTTAEQVGGVRDVLSDLHSYDVPEFLVLEADASEEYGTWLGRVVGT